MRPPMFNDGPPRFRGHRFDDRNWDRPDSEYENLDYGEPSGYENPDHGPPLEYENHGHGPSPGNRQGRRSRWGHDDEHDLPSEEMSAEFNRESTTPVFDEYLSQGNATHDQITGHEAKDGFLQSAEYNEENQESFDQHNDGGNENFQENFNVQNAGHFENDVQVENYEGGDNFQVEENRFNEGNGGENFFKANEENFEGGNLEDNRVLPETGENFNENCGDMQDNASNSHNADTGGTEDGGQSHTDAIESNTVEPVTE